METGFKSWCWRNPESEFAAKSSVPPLLQTSHMIGSDNRFSVSKRSSRFSRKSKPSSSFMVSWEWGRRGGFSNVGISPWKGLSWSVKRAVESAISERVAMPAAAAPRWTAVRIGFFSRWWFGKEEGKKKSVNKWKMAGGNDKISGRGRGGYWPLE